MPDRRFSSHGWWHTRRSTATAACPRAGLRIRSSPPGSGWWQRQCKRRVDCDEPSKGITTERAARLMSLDFVWDQKEAQWEAQLAQLAMCTILPSIVCCNPSTLLCSRVYTIYLLVYTVVVLFDYLSVWVHYNSNFRILSCRLCCVVGHVHTIVMTGTNSLMPIQPDRLMHSKFPTQHTLAFVRLRSSIHC